MDLQHCKFYFSNSKIGVDEDLTHEFKGHMNFTKEQVPPFAFDSKTLNAFLNSGQGGTVYIGVTDDGRILGIILNQYKIDHIVQNVQDVMSRYSPRVKSHRYQIRFIPVLEALAAENEIAAALTFDPSVGIDNDMRNNPHTLRSYRHCWCDKDLAAQTANGILSLQYVVEIYVQPWDPADPLNVNVAVGQMNAQPIHENEEGKAYYRGGACIREFTVQELQALASNFVLEHYQAIERRLKQKRSNLIRQLSNISSARSQPNA